MQISLDLNRLNFNELTAENIEVFGVLNSFFGREVLFQFSSPEDGLEIKDRDVEQFNFLEINLGGEFWVYDLNQKVFDLSGF